MYDFLVVGAGLAGAVFSRIMTDKGYKCLIIDKRSHIGGNIYSEQIEGIEVHKYGPHIFHTDNERVWKFVNKYTSFNHFIYSPVANYKGELYNLPFNMNTFYQLWGVKTPKEAMGIISEQSASANIGEPRNLEEQALKLAGKDIYEKLIKGYTAKQWGRDCKDLPSFIIKRLPFRYTFDNNYFNHPHQGIPIGGYTQMIKNMLDGIEVKLDSDFLKNRQSYLAMANKIIYTGPIDEFYEYKYGALEYRSLRFETEIIDIGNFQGVAGMNFTDLDTPYTRIVEHKHFEFGKGNENKTVITKEYSAKWNPGDEPFYPVNDDKNNKLYKQYEELSLMDNNVIFAGRLGHYKYYDMDKVIASILELTDILIEN